jgi:ribosomal protein L37AE/L43A
MTEYFDIPKTAHGGILVQADRYTCPSCKRRNALAQGWECSECFERDLKKSIMFS